jgi:hypothetical protein
MVVDNKAGVGEDIGFYASASADLQFPFTQLVHPQYEFLLHLKSHKVCYISL